MSESGWYVGEVKVAIVEKDEGSRRTREGPSWGIGIEKEQKRRQLQNILAKGEDNESSVSSGSSIREIMVDLFTAEQKRDSWKQDYRKIAWQMFKEMLPFCQPIE